jgi:hypothetical protein
MNVENDDEVKSGWSVEGELAPEEEELLDDDLCDMENDSLFTEDIDRADVPHSSEMDAMEEEARFLHSTEQDAYLTNVRIAARGNEYSGEVEEDSTVPQLVDKYKCMVEDTIFRFNVPVDEHGFVARQFLTGKMANLVLRIAKVTKQGPSQGAGLQHSGREYQGVYAKSHLLR